ncbi:protein Hook homolog 3 isoform X2 [Neocloeon triangulifer]|uniref:protein Hook homolog 3 isoform X2 n=1 Tax=Neocloeon triangulifer TaxID=2078957 RepID=UPI00286F11FD|nr:protein Hook homolog 3 isoform X2 [Neocloeon triangulifer]
MEKKASEETVQVKSLFKWLQTFEITECNGTLTLQDLSDGVVMAKVLNEIDPEWFSTTWMSSINTNASQNWRLKVSNLKKLLTRLMDYYQECLGYQLSSFEEPNINKIGEHCDAEHLTQLLILVLGCAVQCNNKKEYISRIMSLEVDVQRVIMQAIQDLESCLQELNSVSGATLESPISVTAPGDSFVTSHISHLQEEVRAVTALKDQMAQRCHELDQQATILQEEKAFLALENKRLAEKMKDFEGLEDAGGSQRMKDLKKQVEQLKEEVFKAETARDDYRAKVKLVEKENLDTKTRLVELQQAADEARLLKDELDVAREAADQAAKYEAAIETYKKKLEEFSDLRRQLKLLEDKNIEYMQTTMELEEELKKSGTWKPQVEMYKKQVGELHQKLGDETKRADKVEFENRKLQEKLQAVTVEKERLVTVLDDLKENMEEMKFNQIQTRKDGESPGGLVTARNVSSGPEELDLNLQELKEKIIRLEHENKLLKIKGTGDEEFAVLQTQVEDLTQRMSLEQAENRRANQRILELENQVAETQERLVGSSQQESTLAISIKSQVAQLQSQVQQLSADKEQKSSQLETKETQIADLKQKITFLQDALTRKDAEMQARDEKYQRCIEKAKSVIITLDPKQDASAEVEELRNQIQEKERIIVNMEKEFEKSRGIREMEEKLMLTAFNKFTVQMNRQAAEQRLANMGSTSASFLSRQRQPTPSRPRGRSSNASPPYNTSDAYVDY